MTYVVKPKFHHPELPKNELGFTHRDYEGAVSTLCAGCGHDSISASIIEACFELSIAPHRVAKLSGIGCSSKTPTYFLGNSHGFNSVHGRMPSVLTGVLSRTNRACVGETAKRQRWSSTSCRRKSQAADSRSAPPRAREGEAVNTRRLLRHRAGRGVAQLFAILDTTDDFPQLWSLG
jgi:hypothetical protein